ncbi:uncharacterized protein LOC131638278 [Vicia villosa]|uniref:uncharacterized protein LOC131638278 n=1 Tax=Vicia villosa TaxID=3911 RepID=UPI00273C2CE1|nr:uncharacterized protein LOC131638278 [Vicia villosa]
MGHRANECQSDVKKFFKYGRPGHVVEDCRTNIPTCNNCGEQGHISTNCQKPNKSQADGKVFALKGSQPTSVDHLINGTCYVHDAPLTAIIDMDAAHSFISAKCLKRLELVSSTLSRGIVIDTPYMGSMTTSLVCLNCSLSILCKDFTVDLICLPLNELDVILGNWLEFNCVYINCYIKTLLFLTPKEEGLADYLTTKELRALLEDESKVFVMFASLSIKGKTPINDLPVVCELPEVFSDDISELSPKREIEFTTDLVPSTRSISMAPYRMSVSELAELKSQLEELLDKKFIRPTVLL